MKLAVGIHYIPNIEPASLEELRESAREVIKKHCPHIDDSELEFNYDEPEHDIEDAVVESAIKSSVVKEMVWVDCPYCEG